MIYSNDQGAVLFGTVHETKPLTVALDGRIEVPAVAVASVGTLAAGDKTAILKSDGGEKYVIIGKIL